MKKTMSQMIMKIKNMVKNKTIMKSIRSLMCRRKIILKDSEKCWARQNLKSIGLRLKERYKMLRGISIK